MIVSHDTFMGFISVVTGGTCAWWVIQDSVRLRRALREDLGDPVVRDRVFGSLVGLAIYLVGLYGVADYLGWL